MPYRRRVILLGGAAMAGGGLIGYQELTRCDEIACFEFEHHRADHVPNRLDVVHAGGEERLRAGDVYFSEVVVDWEARETATMSWADLDPELDPSDTIDGEEIRIKIASDFVKIVWRRNDRETVIEAWVRDDDADHGR